MTTIDPNAGARAKAEIPVIAGVRDLAARYDVILSDIWGVVHNGQRHFPAACAALRAFRDKGGVVILVTNAPRPFPPVLKQLAGLGVPDGTFDAVVTSGDVTLSFIAQRGMTPVYHIGPPRDLALFDILQQQTGVRPPLTSLDDAGYVVCTGLFDDDETPADYANALAAMRARGMDLISANPDLVVHVGEREIYCSGALAQAYEEIGGAVIQAGKPFAPIYDRALALAQDKRGAPTPLTRVLAIGDAMRTDIRGAVDRGVDAVFVTRGIHRALLHPDATDGALDRAALAGLVAEAGVRPIAAMEQLAW